VADRLALEALFRGRGFEDFKWIDAGSIVVAHWVRMKCRFGCDGYGRHMTCPPRMPPVEVCREFFREYSSAVVFRFEKQFVRPEDRREWAKGIYERLLALEREVFLSGHEKALVLPMSSCHLCADCLIEEAACPRPEGARPPAEALAVDVFSTVRKHGLPIEVLSEYNQPMNRYAFLLIE
jgi:predicted metal-binding protein